VYAHEVTAELRRSLDTKGLRLLGAAIEHAHAESHDGAQVAAEVVEAPAAEALITASTGADMLVVGSRGHGGFAGLLLGSVSQDCARHARCPVVIVPARAQSRALPSWNPRVVAVPGRSG
jgi:nucleotide-binding universal stress UspA family protein